MKSNSILIAAFVCLTIFNTAKAFASGNILWVIGNGNSVAMSQARQIIQSNASEIIATLNREVVKNTTMAVTTTDYFTDGGQLKKTPSGVTFVNISSPTAAADFAALVGAVTVSATSFWPQGLESSFQALHGAGAQLIQQNVPLNVIYVSDNEDYSCSSKCFGIEPMDNPYWLPYGVNRYSTYFNGLKTSQNVAVSVFPIIGNQASLLSAQCSLANHGLRYQRAMVRSGSSTSYNVCPDSILNSVLAVSKSIATTNLK